MPLEGLPPCGGLDGDHDRNADSRCAVGIRREAGRDAARRLCGDRHRVCDRSRRVPHARGAEAAPFTHYEKSIGSGEVLEKARGSGLRRAVGDLLTCSWCIGPWIATGLGVGLVLQPKITRFIASVFVAMTASDFLHHAYAAAKKQSA